MNIKKLGKGFFKVLKKVVPYVDSSAVIAAQAESGDTIGAALSVVNMIQEHHGGQPTPGLDAAKAVAVAVDDHQKDIHELKNQVYGLDEIKNRIAELERLLNTQAAARTVGTGE